MTDLPVVDVRDCDDFSISTPQNPTYGKGLTTVEARGPWSALGPDVRPWDHVGPPLVEFRLRIAGMYEEDGVAYFTMQVQQVDVGYDTGEVHWRAFAKPYDGSRPEPWSAAPVGLDPSSY